MFDITQDSEQQLGKFGIVHDKGTYDAISLNPENAKLHRERYIEKATALLDIDGNNY